ncbi:MAG: FHA domain-containing protein [Anaerolineae bacterium]|nr:FHA domain-containing protein [Anaerolineae bacterium]
MNEDNKPTITSDSPWGSHNDNNQPTVIPGGQVDSGASTVVDDHHNAFRPTHPPHYQTPPAPAGPPQYHGYPPAPPPPQAQNYYQQPAPQGSANAHTVIIEAGADVDVLAWLAVVEGAGAPRGHIQQLKQETVIGRNMGDLTLTNDPAVSGRHLKIRLEASEEDPEEKHFILYDQGSSNGTYLGQDPETCLKKTNKVYRHELQDGDFILVGQTLLVFKQV